jgi:hypothetical protein
MARASVTVGGKTIAKTDEYEVVEGNIYVSPFGSIGFNTYTI